MIEVDNGALIQISLILKADTYLNSQISATLNVSFNELPIFKTKFIEKSTTMRTLNICIILIIYHTTLRCQMCK